MTAVHGHPTVYLPGNLIPSVEVGDEEDKYTIFRNVAGSFVDINVLSRLYSKSNEIITNLTNSLNNSNEVLGAVTANCNDSLSDMTNNFRRRERELHIRDTIMKIVLVILAVVVVALAITLAVVLI